MARITAHAYHAVDVATFQRSWPDPVLRTAVKDAAWVERTAAALISDPGGAWVADVAGEVVGCAVSRVREGLWILSSFAVRGSHQGRGIGGLLMQAALHHGRGCLRGMLCSSASPAAATMYRRSAFDLHPQMTLRGRVERSRIPVVERIREGSAGDIDLMNSLDRVTRGAAHLSDHDPLLKQFRLVVVDRTNGTGYAYFDESGSVVLLAASDKRTARDLVWEALAASTPERGVAIRHVNAANQWALDVAVEARLDIATSGWIGVRHTSVPRPYIPHGSLL